MDAQTQRGEEDYAAGMDQGYSAALMDARIKLKREECASGMGRRRDNAASKDVQVKLKRKGCAAGMEERDSAESKDAQIKL